MGWLRANPTQAKNQPESRDPQALIELNRVVKSFKNAAGEFTVLKGIDASFRESEFVSIVGRSGSGKSTLLNMITGIDHPSSGSVRAAGTYLHTMDEGRMSVWRGKNMGIVFQFFQLLPMLTLLENVMLPMDFCDMYAPTEREGRAEALLKMVGLEGLEHKYPAAVSGGQQQSAAVARALANDPPILVADEPTGNLDSRTAERVLEIFEEQVALGKTVMMVTHDNGLAQRAARKLVISDGELVNEWVSRAFPDLSHGLLLRLSHTLEPRRFAGDEVLSDPLPSLLLVTHGALTLSNGSAAQRLEPGCLFSREAFHHDDSRRDISRRDDSRRDDSRRDDSRRLNPAPIALRADGPTEALVAMNGSLPDAPELKEALRAAAEARRPAEEQQIYPQPGSARGKKTLRGGPANG